MNSKTLALPLILTTIFVSCLLGVYFYQQSQINSFTSHLISPTPTPTPTSTWETYRNDQYGFEFKYPTGWLLEQDNHSNIIRLLDPETQKSKANDKLSGLFDYYSLSLTQIASENLPKYLNLGLKNISDFTKHSNYFENSHTIAFADKNAVETYEQGECRYYSIFVDNIENILRISLPCNQTKENLTSVQNQILSSFKFTN